MKRWLLRIADRMECPDDLIQRINRDADLAWFLYDLNLLPEQIHTGRQVSALRGFLLGWDAMKQFVKEGK